MNRMVTIFVIGFFFTTGMALARPGDNFGNGGGDRGGSGWSGGGDRGGGGGWNNSGGNGGGWNAGGNTNTGSSANSGNVSGHAESRGDGGSHTHSSSHFSGHFSSPAAHSFSSNNGIHSYSPFSGSHSNGNWYRGNTSRAFNRSEGFHHFSSNSGWGQTSQGIRRFHRFNSPNNSQAYRSHGSIAFQNNGITHRSASLTSRATLPTGFQRRAPALPSHGPLGRHFSSPTLSPRQMSSASVRAQMAAIAGNRTFMAKVAATTPVAGRYNHYYWHTWNGYNYCIYYAPYGGCWY